jgi:hypothetical protein
MRCAATSNQSIYNVHISFCPFHELLFLYFSVPLTSSFPPPPIFEQDVVKRLSLGLSESDVEALVVATGLELGLKDGGGDDDDDGIPWRPFAALLERNLRALFCVKDWAAASKRCTAW